MGADPGTFSQAADGRERILTSALHLFATRGYGRTSTKSIVEHAGVATGLLFYHFESKEDLLRVMLAERTFGPNLHLVAEDLSSEPAEALIAAGHRLVRLARANAEFTTVLIGSREIVPDIYSSFQQDMEQLSVALGDHLKSTLRLKPARARAAAQTFIGSLLASELVLPRRGSDRNMIKIATEVLLHGVST